MNIKEARQKLHDGVDRVASYYTAPIMEAADAYALAAHVAECRRKTGERSDTDSTNHINRALLCCGDGWYCAVARKIEELR